MSRPVQRLGSNRVRRRRLEMPQLLLHSARSQRRSCDLHLPRHHRIVFTVRVQAAFHDADTDTDVDRDILARILGDTSDARDFLKLFLWQAERHAGILEDVGEDRSENIGGVSFSLQQE